MIAYLNGKIDQLEPTFVVVECAGVGYSARISLATYTQLRGKETIKLPTYLQVREDAQTLYGFYDPREKALFELLISVSGVGGNTAMMILSSTQVEEFYQAIQQEDVQSLKQVKGIGAKTAARIILELKDKIKGEAVEAVPGVDAHLGQKKQEALAALVNLGLPKAAMEKRVQEILQQHGAGVAVADIIKLALKKS